MVDPCRSHDPGDSGGCQLSSHLHHLIDSAGQAMPVQRRPAASLRRPAAACGVRPERPTRAATVPSRPSRPVRRPSRASDPCGDRPEPSVPTRAASVPTRPEPCGVRADACCVRPVRRPSRAVRPDPSGVRPDPCGSATTTHRIEQEAFTNDHICI